MSRWIEEKILELIREEVTDGIRRGRRYGQKQKKYSLEEIDRMRQCVADLVNYETLYSEEAVEVRLRTYMLNGTRPDELWDAVEELRGEHTARRIHPDDAGEKSQDVGGSRG